MKQLGMFIHWNRIRAENIKTFKKIENNFSPIQLRLKQNNNEEKVELMVGVSCTALCNSSYCSRSQA